MVLHRKTRATCCVMLLIICSCMADVFAASLQEAKRSIRVRDYSTAESLLNELAVAGDAEAQFLLGSMFSSGQGVKRDYIKSYSLLSKSADQGHVEAFYYLACLYESGKGVAKNSTLAIKWFQEAADAGHKKSATRLRNINLQNESDVQDPLALKRAIKQSDVAMLRRVIDSGFDLDSPDPFGQTPLMLAVAKENLAIVDALLSSEVKVNLKNSVGESALMIAVSNANTDIVDTLLANRVDMNAQNQQGNSALHIAARRNTFDTVEKLLVAGVKVNLKNNTGQTALDNAKNTKMKRLISSYGGLYSKHENHGSAVESTNDTNKMVRNADRRIASAAGNKSPYANWPALNVAAWRGDVKLVDRMLKSNSPQSNIQIDGADSGQHTPLSRAAWQGHTEIVRLLINAGAQADHPVADDLTALHFAVRANHIEIVNLLLKHKANVAVGNPIAEPLIITAARLGHESLTIKLLEYGADQQASFANKTLLMWVAENGLTAVLKKVDLNNIAINTADKLQRSALWIATINGQPAIAKQLLRAGADVTMSDSNGDSPLIIACKSGNLALVKSLLKYNSFVDQANKQGNTPLIIAARQDRPQVIQALIDNGASLETRNTVSRTALMIAAEKGNLTTIRTLIAAGAKVKRKDHVGLNAMQIAIAANHQEVADYLAKILADSSFF